VWITRRAPFGAARLQDADMTVDFAQVTTPNDVVTVVATDPLTNNEQWSEIPERQVSILIDGEWK
jgi:glutamine amidotransferase